MNPWLFVDQRENIILKMVLVVRASQKLNDAFILKSNTWSVLVARKVRMGSVIEEEKWGPAGVHPVGQNVEVDRDLVPRGKHLVEGSRITCCRAYFPRAYLRLGFVLGVTRPIEFGSSRTDNFGIWCRRKRG